MDFRLNMRSTLLLSMIAVMIAVMASPKLSFPLAAEHSMPMQTLSHSISDCDSQLVGDQNINCQQLAGCSAHFHAIQAAEVAVSTNADVSLFHLSKPYPKAGFNRLIYRPPIS